MAQNAGGILIPSLHDIARRWLALANCLSWLSVSDAIHRVSEGCSSCRPGDSFRRSFAGFQPKLLSLGRYAGVAQSPLGKSLFHFKRRGKMQKVKGNEVR